MVSTPTDSLSVNQRRAIAALLEYSTIDEAALAINVNRKTITRWYEQPEFRRALHQAEGASIDQASRQLLVISSKAVKALDDILDNPNQDGATNRRLAAIAILNILGQLRERHTTEERLAALEEKVYG